MSVAILVRDLRALGIQLQRHGDALRFRPRDKVTPALLARLRTHKAELLAAIPDTRIDTSLAARPPWDDRPDGSSGVGVRGEAKPGQALGSQDAQPDRDAARWIERIDGDGRLCLVRADVADLQVVDLPKPCSACGGIVFWWDVEGRPHCEVCQPPRQGLRELAETLRQRFHRKALA